MNNLVRSLSKKCVGYTANATTANPVVFNGARSFSSVVNNSLNIKQQKQQNQYENSSSSSGFRVSRPLATTNIFGKSNVEKMNLYFGQQQRSFSSSIEKIRNVAIIAHVDHGKTSLVDQLLRQSGTLKDEQTERVMDSNALEKERGITIMAKCTSLSYSNHKLNIVDTPGHGDFGGEVERVLSMVDGVVLLVDATEGPMAQTKFVLSKALQAGLRPIVVINKMDRSTIRVDEVESEIFDLFATLGANDDQLNYPTLYASARQGWAVKNRNDDQKGILPLLDTIIDYVKHPKVEVDKPFSMLVTNLESDPFVGRIVTGKVYSGKVKIGTPLRVITNTGQLVEEGKVTKIFARRGVERLTLEEGEAGDIIGIAGFPTATVTNTVGDATVAEPIYAQPIDPPVLSMFFEVNNSPFAGKEGTQLTSLKIKQRLMKELESNVSMQVQFQGEGAFEVKGRGELQLGILLENMRREGFEVAVSQPRVVFKKDPETGATLEPQEEVIIDVDAEYSGVVIEKLSKRKGDLIEMKQSMGKARLCFMVPSRGLIGLRSELINDTKGTGVFNHLFHSYIPHKGPMANMEKGALISMSEGVTSSFALSGLEDRGILFVGPAVPVYGGMIIGENSKLNDLDVNPVKTKHLTNMRTTVKEEGIRLSPPKVLKLEEAIACVKDDELIEITPKSIRLRKRELDIGKRQKAARDKKQF
ncbi:elongation factor tu family protein [Heterostelium album PN500]|uniref:Elongation factor tu family protein n=1 Tax=Heterostelium pallidum (strain ATCC 26659 / Pp 5 / PN500) TaxID=670386 RepID=D3BBY5_HETP5|nr:elongation factor tu family protein [Heterostelium album PN500]EFA81168.1 elongation factor tu family protein [Heterostelium album PN500]|eukprot:XP_020433286.1 elongation factor tu family protein [Heterostelium album PN500]